MGVKYICDICPNELKLVAYIVAICKEQITGDKVNPTDINSIINYGNKLKANTKSYMICEECYRVWQHLLTMRLGELEKAKADFVGYLKQQLKKEDKAMDNDLQNWAEKLIQELPHMPGTEKLPNIYFVAKAGAGKTYSANFMIKKYGYEVAKFAYPVYMIAEKYFHMTAKDRKLLQVIGTDAGRDLVDSEIWVDRFKQDMIIVKETARKLGKPMPQFVMDDCRFPNEHEILKELGFVGIYIDVPDEVRKGRLIGRDGTAQEETLNHKSETLIDTFKHELIKLDGSGNLERSYQNLNNLLLELRSK